MLYLLNAPLFHDLLIADNHDMKIKMFYSCLAVYFVLIGCHVATAGDFDIQKVKNRHIDISFNDRPLVRLMVANDKSSDERAHETYKVFTHVIDPLDPKAERTLTKGPHGKYTHHRGIFFGMSDAKVEGIGTYDMWHMGDDARQEFRKILKKQTTDHAARVTLRIDWVVDGQEFLVEKRTITVHRPTSNKRLAIDQRSTVIATQGKTVLKGDPEHGGYQFRASQAVAENNSAEYLYPKGVSKSDVKEGKTIPWAAQTFTIDDRRYRVLHMAHPTLPGKNNRYSAYRPYGRFGVYFEDTIEEGESATYRIHVMISPGGFPEDNPRQKMQKTYEQYVQETK